MPRQASHCSWGGGAPGGRRTCGKRAWYCRSSRSYRSRSCRAASWYCSRSSAPSCAHMSPTSLLITCGPARQVHEGGAAQGGVATQLTRALVGRCRLLLGAPRCRSAAGRLLTHLGLHVWVLRLHARPHGVGEEVVGRPAGIHPQQEQQGTSGQRQRQARGFAQRPRHRRGAARLQAGGARTWAASAGPRAALWVPASRLGGRRGRLGAGEQGGRVVGDSQGGRGDRRGAGRKEAAGALNVAPPRPVHAQRSIRGAGRWKTEGERPGVKLLRLCRAAKRVPFTTLGD